MKILTEFNPTANEIKFLEQKLFQYNRQKVDGYKYENFILKSVDSSNSVIAGLVSK